MEAYNKSLKLINENIDVVVKEVADFYVHIKSKKSMKKTAFRLALEETLLQFMEQYGSEKETTIKCYRSWGTVRVEISQDGFRREWVPWDEELKASYDILARLGAKPRYFFSRTKTGRNNVYWDVPKQKVDSLLPSIFISIIIAVIASIIINALPTASHDLVVETFINPFFTKLTAVFSAVATPLVFLAVIGGIIGLGDVKTFGKIGNMFLIRMLISYLIAGGLMALFGSLAYGFTETMSGEAGSSAWKDIVKLVLDIIPDNLLQPFTTDNGLQVIVISIFIGIVLLVLGTRVTKIKEIISEATTLVYKMMSYTCKLLPFIVFFGVANLICKSNASQLISIGKMSLIFIIINAIFVPLMIIRTRVVTGVPLKYILPKQMKTLMINITTSSQVAALPENMKCCKEKFGIDSRLTDFALPLGMVVYMPSGAVFIALAAWGSSMGIGVSITVSLMIQIVLVSIILAIAAPPIPGSAFVVIPIIFAACGISNDAFPIAVIFCTIIGYFCPAINGFDLQLEVLMCAKKLGLVNEEKLKSKYKDE